MPRGSCTWAEEAIRGMARILDLLDISRATYQEMWRTSTSTGDVRISSLSLKRLQDPEVEIAVGERSTHECSLEWQ